MKLDLHTHPDEMVFDDDFEPVVNSGENRIGKVDRIAKRIRDAGIDGIALTPHEGLGYARWLYEIFKERHPDIYIAIGQEVGRDSFSDQFLDIYFMEGKRVKKTMRIWCHPSKTYMPDPDAFIVNNKIDSIEVANYDLESKDISLDVKWINELADKHNLLKIKASDAHFIGFIGRYYTEIEV